jgi:hypothetical protein
MTPAFVLLLAVPTLQQPVGTPAPAPETSSVKARSHLFMGEVARVDLRGRVLVVKTGDAPTTEVEVAVDDRTRITSGGRVSAFDEIRAGDRVSVSCTDDLAGGHRARLVVIRAGRLSSPRLTRSASPGPAPSPSPSPTGSPSPSSRP